MRPTTPTAGSRFLLFCATAKLAGFDDKQLRLLLGGTAGAYGARSSRRCQPEGADIARPAADVRRIHQYISMAVPMLWLRQRDAIGAIGLAVNASRERNNGHPEESERIQELLADAQELWRDCADLEDVYESARTSGPRSSSSTWRT